MHRGRVYVVGGDVPNGAGTSQATSRVDVLPSPSALAPVPLGRHSVLL